MLGSRRLLRRCLDRGVSGCEDEVVEVDLPLDAPVTMATFPSNALCPLPLTKLVEAVRAGAGRDMFGD